MPSQQQLEYAEWGDRRGDRWHRRWTRTTGTSTLTDLVVEIRNGARETSTLVASSVAARQNTSVAAITLTDTNLAAGIIDWAVAPAETLKVESGAGYTIEIEALVDGHATTIQRHAWRVDPQVAVRP